jgi:hypothetical protein
LNFCGQTDFKIRSKRIKVAKNEISAKVQSSNFSLLFRERSKAKIFRLFENHHTRQGIPPRFAGRRKLKLEL